MPFIKASEILSITEKSSLILSIALQNLIRTVMERFLTNVEQKFDEMKIVDKYVY
jgi:hypothetical protein